MDAGQAMMLNLQYDLRYGSGPLISHDLHKPPVDHTNRQFGMQLVKYQNEGSHYLDFGKMCLAMNNSKMLLILFLHSYHKGDTRE